jgi:hypothetical protein
VVLFTWNQNQSEKFPPVGLVTPAKPITHNRKELSKDTNYLAVRCVLYKEGEARFGG